VRIEFEAITVALAPNLCMPGSENDRVDVENGEKVLILETWGHQLRSDRINSRYSPMSQNQRLGHGKRPYTGMVTTRS
jgi:hypothetical protein